MDKRTIQVIMILMSVALMGISIIQFYWLKNGIDLEAQNFDTQVRYSLNRVKQNLEDDANQLEKLNRSIERSQSSIFNQEKDPLEKIIKPSLDDYRRDKLETQVANIAWLLNPEYALNSISPPDLSRYLRVELLSQGIDLNYDFGVFSNKDEDYIITNGKFNVVNVIGKSSNGGVATRLSQSMYQVNLFDGEGRTTIGSLRIFFPQKTSFLIKSVLPALISSILLTGLILFCFVYTINVILTQKKVSLMKTDFINNMTHEFKTPIATISLAADSIGNPMVKSNESLIERYADIIKQENKRMLTQVEKVLQIARLDKKDFTLKLVDINLNDLVTIALENTRLRVNQREGKINAHLSAQNAKVIGDENHISNVLHNLLDNAIKYSPEPPDISITTKDVSNGVEIKITDKGIGMSKEDLKRIFEKFYRVSTGNLHDVKGFGLGLSYVKAITDAHKGRVKAQSELGKGSSFTVYFPHDFSRVK